MTSIIGERASWPSFSLERRFIAKFSKYLVDIFFGEWLEAQYYCTEIKWRLRQ
jgi:hypothetical protein